MFLQQWEEQSEQFLEALMDFCIAVVFVVVDYITGLMAAVINKEVSSEVGFSRNREKSRDFLFGSSRPYRGHTDYL